MALTSQLLPEYRSAYDRVMNRYIVYISNSNWSTVASVESVQCDCSSHVLASDVPPDGLNHTNVKIGYL